MVAAIKMVDDAKGNLFAPADWESSEPAIKNTKAGVLEYYQEKYKEEKQKKESGKQEGFLIKLKKKFGFASSASSVTRAQSKEDANSVASKKEPLEKGATGDGN